MAFVFGAEAPLSCRLALGGGGFGLSRVEGLGVNQGVRCFVVFLFSRAELFLGGLFQLFEGFGGLYLAGIVSSDAAPLQGFPYSQGSGCGPPQKRPPLAPIKPKLILCKPRSPSALKVHVQPVRQVG